MAKTRSMTRNQNHDDASSKKRNKTCDNGGVSHWSDLNHDVLYLIMTRLRVVDFVAFSGVCKSWRSLALHNKNNFMASEPPMLMRISTRDNILECCLEDFEGRKFKTLLPHSDGRTFIGSICGYLILFGMKTHDFWLVNPITRHELHFPPIHNLDIGPSYVIVVLVFSPSISRWVFVVLNKCIENIWFSIAGKGEWNIVSSALLVCDLHAYKGKIYTRNPNGHLCEMRLNLEPKLTLLQHKMFSNQPNCFHRFVSSSENLYVTKTFKIYSNRVDKIYSSKVDKLDFNKMKLVPLEETRDEYAFFFSNLKPGAFKPGLWVEAHHWPKLSGKGRFFIARMWYFPMNVRKLIFLTSNDLLFALLSMLGTFLRFLRNTIARFGRCSLLFDVF